jgi:hypothetical protein
MKCIAGKIIYPGAEKMSPWFMRNKSFLRKSRKKLLYRRRPSIFDMIMMKKGAKRRNNMRIMKIWPSHLCKYMPI